MPLINFSSQKDAELNEYYEKGMSMVKRYCRDNQYYRPAVISIRFENLKPDVLATCYLRLNGYTILFNKRNWYALSELDRTQLVMHELAHCIFNEDHIDDKQHFMNSYMSYIPADTLKKQLDEYLTKKCQK